MKIVETYITNLQVNYGTLKVMLQVSTKFKDLFKVQLLF